MGPKLLTLARVVALVLPLFLLQDRLSRSTAQVTSHNMATAFGVCRTDISGQSQELLRKPQTGTFGSELTLDYFGLMVCSLCAGMHSPGGVTPHALLAARDGSQLTQNEYRRLPGIER
jgi:hypothetical protein